MFADALSELLDAPVEVLRDRPLGGGCISDVSVVQVRCGDGESLKKRGLGCDGDSIAELVVKRNAAGMVSNFHCEADGLRAIEQTGTLRVPRVFACDVVDREAFLAIELIKTGGRPVFDAFGRQLAKLHRATAGDRIGWPSDNYLGSAKQINAPAETWTDFFADRRIGFQLRWAVDQRLADRQLRTDCDQIIARIDALLAGRENTTSLLHGDLWSGNYLFDDRNQPALIDPAVYHGCREAEWGMIKWLGNCPKAFEESYQAEWPMPDGWQRRSDVYLLYHQLNHLNLFGGSYADACRRTAKRLLQT